MGEPGFEINNQHIQQKPGDILELVRLEQGRSGGGLFFEFAKHNAGDLPTSWVEL